MISLEQVLIAQGADTKLALPTATSTARLTKREIEVLRLLATGLTNAQIASKLIISLSTVNSHVDSIYTKLGVNSRVTATCYAIEYHLV